MSVRSEYHRQRRLGWQAKWAYRNAKTIEDWDSIGGHWLEDERYERMVPGESVMVPGPVRLRCVPDECWDIESYELSTREMHTLIERANRDGVWGVVGEFWTGEAWEHADSCFGFIGDDFRDSGYDTDIMAATLKAWRKHSAEELEDCLLYA